MSQIEVTGNARIDQATAEIAVALRDGGYGRRDQDRYAEAVRLRNEIMTSARDSSGPVPLTPESARWIERQFKAMTKVAGLWMAAPSKDPSEAVQKMLEARMGVRWDQQAREFSSEGHGVRLVLSMAGGQAYLSMEPS